MELKISEQSSKMNAKLLLQGVHAAFTFTCEECRCFGARCFYLKHFVAATCVSGKFT